MRKSEADGGLSVFDVLLLGTWFIMLMVVIVGTHKQTLARIDALEAQIEELHR